MRLPRGVRYIENDCQGIQMAQVTFSLPVNGIFLHCTDCGRRDRLTGDATRRVTNEQAIAIFESRGWTVKQPRSRKRTRCPEHANRRRRAVTEGQEDQQ